MAVPRDSLASGGGRQHHPKPDDWQEQYNLLMIRKSQADHQLEVLEAILSEEDGETPRFTRQVTDPLPPLADESREVISRKALLAKHRHNFLKADIGFGIAAVLVGGLAVYLANLPVFDPALMDQSGSFHELTQLMRELVAMGHAGIHVYEPMEYTGTGD